MKTGAFVCSCAETCDIDLEGVREEVTDVDVVASSSLLCGDGLPAMERIVDEYELDQFIVTCPEPRVQGKFRRLAEEKGLHPESASFVDQREGAGWVHDEPAATAKTARLVNARRAGLAEEAVSRSVSREVGDSVAVVGDAAAAAALTASADVTLIADGEEFADADVDLDDVTIERGRVAGVEGELGGFEVTLRARVTEDCVSCMKCVREGPDGQVTRSPVDVDPAADGGPWVDVCPTDAIEMDGVERTLEVDQIVHPGASSRARGGRIGFYTGPVDAGTVAAVGSLIGGVEKPKFLDLDMDVCAAGEASQQGCTACVDACPHDAVARAGVDSVAFDEVACQNCGACTSDCPTGAVRLREPSNERIAREVEALLADDERGGGWLFGRRSSALDRRLVAFVCSERAATALREYGRLAAGGRADVEYPPILPVRVNCTDAVGESHVVHALAAGADGVVVVGCGDACLHSGPDPKAELVSRLNRATTDLGLGERVGFVAADPADHESFVEDITAFGESVDESPVPAGEHEATGRLPDDDRSNQAFDGHAWTLESVRAILDHVDPERGIIRGLKDFGRMEVNDACALTPTCSNLCPTDAIRRTDDGLQFNHERCVNCGLCEEGCPETAITMRDGLDVSLLPENAADGDDPAWTTVLEGGMLDCARCGTPFTSKRSAEKVAEEVGDMVAGVAPNAERSIFEYCNDCRTKLLFENGGSSVGGD